MLENEENKMNTENNESEVKNDSNIENTESKKTTEEMFEESDFVTPPQESEPERSASSAQETVTAETAETEETEAEATGDQQEILVAAAASLQYVMEDKIQPAFEKENPDIKLSFTFDSSGKLQTQIEEGLEADVFMSAATKQMKALDEEGLIASDTMVDLLEILS